MRSKPFIAALLLLCAAVSHGGAQEVSPQRFAGREVTPAQAEILRQRVRFTPSRTLDKPLPASVDNSRLKYFPPIFNQSGGSCAQASGIGYMFTYEVNRLLDRDASSDANRFSYEFAWHMLNEGEDQGSFVSQGLMLARNYGIMTLADYGVSGAAIFKWATGYEKYLNAIRYRASEILIYDDSIPLMKRYLYDAGDGSAAGGVLTFSAMSTGWVIDNYYDGPSQTGYHSLLTSLAIDGSHAMTIVGYDDTVCYTDRDGVTHEGAFIVVNSWGTWTHDNGRYYLPYDFFRDKSVPNTQLSNTVEGVRVRIHEPKVVFKVAVDYTSRDDIRFQTGLSSDKGSTYPEKVKPVSVFENQGGDYPMRGAYFGSEVELAIDLTEVMDTSREYGRYFLNVNKSVAGKKRGEGSVTALSLIDYRSGEPVEYPYRGPLPARIEGGNNWFSIGTKPLFSVPVSAYTYSSGSQEEKGTFVVRTADGRAGKFIFNPSAEDGKRVIRYQVRK